MTTTTVDVIVLGTGSAAQSVVYPCREAGWSVVVVDDHPPTWWIGAAACRARVFPLRACPSVGRT